MPTTYNAKIRFPCCTNIRKIRAFLLRELGLLLSQGLLSPRSVAIATYALCGFANPGSVGVQLAVLTSLCPERRADFARVVGRAFVAGLCACFMTACVAGVLV